MNSIHARYRFDNTPPPPPIGETREEKLRRILKTMPAKAFKEPQLLLKFLRRSRESEQAVATTTKQNQQ